MEQKELMGRFYDAFFQGGYLESWEFPEEDWRAEGALVDFGLDRLGIESHPVKGMFEAVRDWLQRFDEWPDDWTEEVRQAAEEVIRG